MNIQDIQNIEQSVSKVYETLNELASNHSIELIDLAFPEHDGIQDPKAVGELMCLRQSVNSLKNACELLTKKLTDAIQEHTIEVEALDKGNYSRGDTLTYLADGIEFTVTGEFYIDRQGLLHHPHVFDDGTEMDVTAPYLKD